MHYWILYAFVLCYNPTALGGCPNGVQLLHFLEIEDDRHHVGATPWGTSSDYGSVQTRKEPG